MGKEFSTEPRVVPRVETKYRRIVSPLPHPDSVPVLERLRRFVAGESEATWSEAAGELGLSEGAMKAAVHRLRERYRVLLRDEIAQTVTDPQQVEEEMRYLLRSVGA